MRELLSAKSSWGKAILLQVIITTVIALWSILLVIPGIIKKLAYSISAYILEENPEMSPKEAMELSQRLMKGNKWRYFCLQMSFIGWIVLSIISCGIGILWLNPYMNAATIVFFNEISQGQSE